MRVKGIEVKRGETFRYNGGKYTATERRTMPDHQSSFDHLAEKQAGSRIAKPEPAPAPKPAAAKAPAKKPAAKK